MATIAGEGGAATLDDDALGNLLDVGGNIIGVLGQQALPTGTAQGTSNSNSNNGSASTRVGAGAGYTAVLVESAVLDTQAVFVAAASALDAQLNGRRASATRAWTRQHGGMVA